MPPKECDDCHSTGIHHEHVKQNSAVEAIRVMLLGYGTSGVNGLESLDVSLISISSHMRFPHLHQYAAK